MEINLSSLFPGLPNVEHLIDSEEEVKPSVDLVVGELPDVLKRLYTLLRLSEEPMKKAIIKARDVSCSDQEIAENICDECRAMERYKSLRSLFILASRNEFNLWGDNCCSKLGVRKNFLLVKPLHYKKKRLVVAIKTIKESFNELRNLTGKGLGGFCPN